MFLQRAFLDLGMNVRIPCLPLGNSGDLEGYDFSSEWSTKLSYIHAITTLGKLTDRGSGEISQNTFLEKKFILPFQLTQSINILDQKTNEKVIQANAVTSSDQKILYLKFKNELTKTLKITCIFLQHRSIACDSQRRVFKVARTTIIMNQTD